MTYKKFFIYFIVFTLSLIGIVIAINYYFDFYAVLNQGRKVYYESINDRYAKIVYIIKNPERFNTFIWGSSRTQKMNPHIIDIRAYNMAASAGSPEDCLAGLKILLSNNVNIKNIYLGIDNFSYKNDYYEDIKSFNRIPYSENMYSNIKYLARVALKEPDFHKIKGYLGLTDYRLESNYLTTSGRLEVPEYVEEKIENSVENHVYDEKFKNASYSDDKNAHIDYTISIIREIKKLCDDNNINFVVFFNPVHITSYLKDDIHLSNQFKRELVKTTDFYDFNYINFVTINNYFWYETSHPRYFVCDWELKVITNQYDKNIPEDFGHLITKENIDYYCNKYIIDRENFKKPSKQYIPEEPII